MRFKFNGPPGEEPVELNQSRLKLINTISFRWPQPNGAINFLNFELNIMDLFSAHRSMSDAQYYWASKAYF